MVAPLDPKEVDLDNIDRSILRILLRNARQSARAIAREIGMSPNAIGERIGRMERDGVIVGYRVEVDPEKVGFDLGVLVGLQIQQGRPISATVARLLEIREVSCVYIVTGTWDLVIELRATNHRHLREIVIDNLWQVPGFRHSETMVVLSREERPAGWLAGALPELID